MFALIEDSGKFLAGRILSEGEASAQVELDSGKRVKAKSTQVMLRFDKPVPADLIRQAQALAEGIELDMAWEFAPAEEFGFADLARDYFSANASVEQLAAMLLRLAEAPHYFRRAGKGRFRKASAEVLQQALAAIEKRKQIAAQIDAWALELASGSCPPPVREQLFKILFKPDKNAPEYKAVVQAARDTHKGPLELLQNAGAMSSSYQFHWQRFLFENFPKGTRWPEVQAPAIADELPLATVGAYSIDDSATTEIDDALSVQGLGSGTVTVGVHIAAPGLAIAPGSAIDQLGRARLSTVYMPGYKLTMLPDAVVQHYTLEEGRACLAVSLYVTVDEATLAIRSHETRLERVPITANLRHDQLDGVVTEAWLLDPGAPSDVQASALPRVELGFLYRLAQTLKRQREVVRGKPENFSRPDYNFRLVGNDGAVPTGDEQVHISVRQRGAPLDLIVAEAMILANSTWGQWLAELGVPAIYRSQASLAPGVKVRMGTKALPHAGIGVPAYAWSTSPLRRYTDMVNQWQIIACARHGKTAALVAPFKPKDAELFSIISMFDAAYTAYNAHQGAMERFWTIKHLAQANIQELVVDVIKDLPGGTVLVRATGLPLVFSVLASPGLARGERLRVRINGCDEIALDVHATVVERLGAAGLQGTGGNDAPEDEEETDVAGPLTIAVDLDAGDTESDSPAAATVTP